MKIKMPKPTKVEMIRMFLSQWDPAGEAEEDGFMSYNYEAEDIAQRIRKNSKPEKIEAAVREVMGDKLRLEGIEAELKDDDRKQVAFLIHTWMKSQ